MNEIIRAIESEQLKKDLPKFNVGDTLRVMVGRILEHESKTIHNEGWNEGRRHGQMEEKQATAIRLFEMGTKAEDISYIVDASINLVRQWISAPAYTTNQTI